MATSSKLRQRSRTMLWCVPRSISTAFTKCLTAIENNQIWFEPFNYCKIAALKWAQDQTTELPPDCIGNEEAYQQVIDLLAEDGSVHFKPEYISYSSVKRHLESTSGSHVFVKDMAYDSDKQASYLPDGYRHTFMIRHPFRTIYSYRKGIFKFLLANGILKGPAADEKAFDVERDNPFFFHFHESQYSMWKYVRENIDSHPIVVDGDDLLANPAEMLPKYCRAVGLPYAESLLKWDASADVARSWKLPAHDLLEQISVFYNTAIGSCEFFPASEIPSREHVTPDVIRYTDRVLKNYEEMHESRIKLENENND